jgi:hypothetical protein
MLHRQREIGELEFRNKGSDVHHLDTQVPEGSRTFAEI